MIGALRRSGELDRTYVFFLSDNGFFFGEHRLERSKFLPYEPAIRLPLLIRGPGIRANSTTDQLAANIDLAPTIVELAGAHADRSFDGRTLVPFWTHTALRTRRPILLESFAKATDITPGVKRARAGAGGRRPSIAAPIENYLGVRLGRYKYVEYETGDRELYDLQRDPYELTNRFERPAIQTGAGLPAAAAAAGSRTATAENAASPPGPRRSLHSGCASCRRAGMRLLPAPTS